MRDQRWAWAWALPSLGVLAWAAAVGGSRWRSLLVPQGLGGPALVGLAPDGQGPQTVLRLVEPAWRQVRQARKPPLVEPGDSGPEELGCPPS